MKQIIMNIKEKAGDFILDISKLVFGGVILASIVSEDIDKAWLYTIGAIVFTLCFCVSFMLYKISGKEDR